MWLGRVISIQEDRIDEAGQIFKKILENDPENFVAQYYYGRILENQGKLKEAIYQYQLALGMEYQISKTHLQMGNLLENLGLEDRASEHFNRIKSMGVNENDISRADEIAHKEVSVKDIKQRSR
jgi:tetratricopeptide (TPR) repeat protein